MVAMPGRWVVANFRPNCPPRNVYLCFWESSVYPAGGCRMRPKSLPHAAGCEGNLPESSFNSGLVNCRRRFQQQNKRWK